MAQEKNLENKVKAFLKDNNCWNLKTWSNGVQRSGVPDILACCKGHFIGIELKADKGKPSALQIYNLKKIEQSGGYAVLLYPTDYELFKSFIDYLSKGFEKNADYFYKELRKQIEKYTKELETND